MRSAALAVLAVAAVFTVLAIVWVAAGPSRPTQAQVGQMGQMGPPGDPTPAVKGFYKGREITFIHTEASDRQVAEMLTKMMGLRVLVVRSLAEVPARLLAHVYIFTNGLPGDGPFGFQPDVFDSAPGDGRYTPLRRAHLITWKEGVQARLLRSVEEITRAAGRGELTIRRPGVVVNMPFLTWPGGRR